MIVIESIPLDQSARTPRQVKKFNCADITIGRSSEADFHLEGDRISSLGLRIVAGRDCLVLLDGSEGGSVINGQHGWGARPIREEDHIRIGPYRLIVRQTSAVPPTRVLL